MWNLESLGALNGTQFPSCTLQQHVVLRWNGKNEVELSSAEFWANMPEFPAPPWAVQTLSIGPRLIPERGGTSIQLVFPVERPFVQAIEDWRQGRATPLLFQVTLNLHFRSIRRIEVFPSRPSEDVSVDQQGRTIGQERLFVRDLGEPSFEQLQFMIDVQRDQWITILKTLGWNEFAIFEVPVRALKRHERFEKALGLLDSAQVAFRQGQWSAVVTDARRAVEAAASVAAPDADRKAKFEALVREVLPNAHDAAKAADQY